MSTDLQRNPRGFFSTLLIFLVVIALIGAILYYIAINFYVQPEIAADATYVAEVAPEPVGYTTADILVDEDFSADRGAWDLSPVGQAVYDGGGLILNDDQFNGNAWARPHLSLENYILEVHGRWLGGAIGGAYGIEFRVDDDSGDYYSFHLENGGRYVIGKQTNGSWVEMRSGHLPEIQNNGGVNLFRIEALGDTFVFYINGDYVAHMQDNSLPTGDIILFATKAEGTEQYLAAFDNLLIARNFGAATVDAGGDVAPVSESAGAEDDNDS